MPPPVNPPPTNEPGAISNPRMLNRWLDHNPVHPLRRTETYFALPAFEYTTVWRGYSEIIAAFNYTAGKNFSLKQFTPPENPNYVACVAWVDEDRNMFRYKLWEDVGEVMWFDAPLYDGEIIKKNFRIEIWNTKTGNDLTLITLAGGGTATVNGEYGQVDANNWAEGFVNILATDGDDAYNGAGGVLTVAGAVVQYTTTDRGLWGLWELEAGVAPTPLVTAVNVVSSAAALTFYTTVLGGYDYMWADDAALTTAAAPITDFSYPLDAGVFPLPLTWPAASVPVINN